MKLLGVFGREHAASATPRAIEPLRRRRTGETWGELLRPAPERPRIIVTPWQPVAPILVRGEAVDVGPQ